MSAFLGILSAAVTISFDILSSCGVAVAPAGMAHDGKALANGIVMSIVAKMLHLLL